MVITFAQPKGGAGKTTVVVNLAVALLGKGYSVGLIDTDTQNSLAKWFERRELNVGCNSKLECAFVQGQITDVIKAMSDRNDFVLIDTAGYNSLSLNPALMSSNLVISPFRPKQYDVECVELLLSCVTPVRFINTRMKHFSVLNQCPTVVNSSRAKGAVEYLKGFGLLSFDTFLYTREVYADSGEEGRGVTEYDNDKAISEVNNLCEEILNACKNV